MRTFLLAFFAVAVSLPAQTLHGLGLSSKTCVDLDGDGFGTGPIANLITTVSGSVTPGVQTVTLGATTGLVVGQRVRFDANSNLEFVTLTAVSGSTITGTFLAAHAAGVSVSAGTKGDGSAWFPGYATDDPGCLGLDADDRDATVHTAAQGIAKYGSLTAFLAKVGRDWQVLEADTAADAAGSGQAAGAAALLINPSHIYYVAPALPSGGCVGTGAQCTGQSYPTNNCTSINSPCLTISNLVSAGYSNTGAGGDLIIARDGWNNSALQVTLYPGASTRYNGLWSYPGEHAIVTTTVKLGQPNSCTNPTQTNYIWIDGLRLMSTVSLGGAIVGGTCANATSSQNHDIVITHVNGTESDGGGLAPITGFNHIDNWTIAYNTLHDDNCPSGCNTPHGIYLGSHEGPSSNTTIRRNLIYRNSWNGLHWNGVATGFYIDQNVVYDNGITGLDFQEGLSNSFIRSNLVFNNVKQLLFYDYPGNCPTQTGYDPGTPFVLCPVDQTHNLIENNTFYMTGNAHMSNPGSNPDAGCPVGVTNCAQPPIQISNASSPLAGNMGGNIFRNNIIVSYGHNNAVAPVAFGDPTANGTCGATCQGWAATTTFDHNLFWQSDGLGGTNVLRIGATNNNFTCSTAGSVTAAMTSCNVADPQFAAGNISNWNVESYFDLRLLPSSPALHAATTTAIPNYDAAGKAYTENGPGSNPSLGALERNLYSQGWTTLTGAGLSPSVAPGNGDPGLSNCLTPSGLDASPCPPNGYPFQTQYTQQLTAWTDGIGRDRPGSPKQLAWFGGGHADYIGNEVYTISLNRATPSVARIIGPSKFAAPGLTVLQTWNLSSMAPQPALADGAPASRHSPGILAYNPDTDKMGMFGGALAGGNGNHTYDTWEFNFGATAWERYAGNTNDVDCSNHGTGYSSCGLAVGRQVDPIATFNGSFGGANIYDPITKSYWVYWNAAGGFSVITQYYPSFHQHVVRAMTQPSLTPAFVGGGVSRVFVSDRRWIFVTNWYNNVLTSWKLDISGVASQTPSPSPNPGMVAVSTDPSCDGLLKTPSPGLVYLPAQGRILGFPAGTGGNAYYLMDPATWTCTSGTFTGGPSTSPLNQYIIGKMQYFDSLGATLLLNDVGANAPRVLNLNVGDPGTGGSSSEAPPSGGGTPPTISMVSPISGSIVSGTLVVSANVSASAGVASVQFKLDGAGLGAVLTSAPYSVSWDTNGSSNGSHTLTATVVDTKGGTATSAGVFVTVNNGTDPSGIPPAPPTTGLSGYWNFDENTANIAHDTSGKAYNGTVTASWASGKINSALSFNGNTDNVVTPNIPLSNTFSISAWVNPAVTSQGGFNRIAETQFNAGLYLGTDTSGTKYKFIVNNASGSPALCGASYGCAQGGTIASGWHLITGTFDGTTAILYVDNAMVATDRFSPPANTSFPLYIGRYYAGNGYGWKGSVDEVRLYNRALTSAEVSAIYNYAGALTSKCDLSSDGVVNIIDVQVAINQALGTNACTNADLDQDGKCTVVDVQRVVTAVLGGACKIGP